MRNQVLTSIFVLLVVCDEGKSAPKLDVAPRFEATGLSARFKPHGTDGNVWRIAQAQPVASKPSKSFQEGLIAGEAMAKQYPTRGKMLGGFVTGALTFCIGTGIGYFIVGPADLDMQARSQISGQSSEYKNGFMEGWDKKTRSRKRDAFLSGGALGTLATLVFYVFALGLDGLFLGL